MVDQAELMKRQQVLADFGEFAIRSEDLDAVLTEACRLVGEALGTDRAKVLEIQEGRQELLVRAGVGWAPDVVGTVRLKMTERSSESYAIEKAEPVVSQDIANEDRFGIPEFMKKAGVAALVNVPIFVPGQRPYGILQVDDTKPHDFGDDEIQFLRTYAMILGPVIDRLHLLEERTRAAEELRKSEDRQAFLLRLSDTLRATAGEAIIGRAVEMLTEELGLDLCYVVDVFPDQDRADVVHQLRRGADMPEVPALIRLSDFPQAFLDWQERTLVTDDLANDPALTEIDRRNVAAMRFGALIAAPVRRGAGKPLWSIVAVMAEARHWTAVEVALMEETAERTWAALERSRAEAALRASEERLRLIVESARDYAIFTLDGARRVDTWLPGAEAVFGWTRDEIEGRSSDILFIPEDRDQGVPQDEVETALREGKAPDVRWHLHKDGRRVFIEGQTVPLFEGGSHSGFLKIGQDVTERRQRDELLHESEERFRQFGAASSDVLWIRNAASMQFEYVSPAFNVVYGLPRESAMAGDDLRSWLRMIEPEDRRPVVDGFKCVRAGEHVTHEFRIRRASDGERRWMRDTGFPLFDAEGQVQRIGGIGHDITEEKETADRLAVLVAELQHRTKNLMGVVRSIGEQTQRSASDLSEFMPRFRERMEALTRVNTLLSSLHEGHRITFDQLIRSEIDALGPVAREEGRVTLEGPKNVRLRSSTVQTFSLALHELATNAVKYGALKQEEGSTGQLTVSWKLALEDGRPWLHVDWRESGVTMPSEGAASQGGGSGRRLIDRALPYQLGARTSFVMEADGVHCTIAVPVSEETALKE